MKSLRCLLFSLSFSKSTQIKFYRLFFLFVSVRFQTPVIDSQRPWINRKDSFYVFRNVWPHNFFYYISYRTNNFSINLSSWDYSASVKTSPLPTKCCKLSTYARHRHKIVQGGGILDFVVSSEGRPNLRQSRGTEDLYTCI